MQVRQSWQQEQLLLFCWPWWLPLLLYLAVVPCDGPDSSGVVALLLLCCVEVAC
jgi:hypothetical protein